MTRLSIASHGSAGNTPDLALIHGWGYDSSVFGPVVEALAKRCRVHLVDLPGYGRNRDIAPMPLPELALVLGDCLPQGTTLCGWSLGGQIALSALAKNSRQFPRLIMVSSTPKFAADEGWSHGVAPILLAGFARALKSDPAALMTRFGALVNQGDTSARELTRLLAANQSAAMATPAALTQGLDWLAELDFRPLLPKLTQPVLLVHGALDPLIPLAAAEAARDALANATLQAFPKAAHVPFLSDPERFVDLVGDFACTADRVAC